MKFKTKRSRKKNLKRKVELVIITNVVKAKTVTVTAINAVVDSTLKTKTRLVIQRLKLKIIGALKTTKKVKKDSVVITAIVNVLIT